MEALVSPGPGVPAPVPAATRPGVSEPRAAWENALQTAQPRVTRDRARRSARREALARWPRRQQRKSLYTGPARGGWLRGLQGCPLPAAQRLLGGQSAGPSGAGVTCRLQKQAPLPGAAPDRWAPALFLGCPRPGAVPSFSTRLTKPSPLGPRRPSPPSPRVPPCALGARPQDACLLLQVVRSYKATVQQTLDILFLQEGSEFLSSTDASSRDSADRTIIAWDFRSAAKISNQIFHVRTPACLYLQSRPPAGRIRVAPGRPGSQLPRCGRGFSGRIRRQLGRLKSPGWGKVGSGPGFQTTAIPICPSPVPAQRSRPRGKGAEGSPVRMGRKGAEQSETSLLASAAPASPRVSALPLPVAVVGAVTWERRRGPCSQAPGVTALDSPRTGRGLRPLFSLFDSHFS